MHCHGTSWAFSMPIELASDFPASRFATLLIHIKFDLAVDLIVIARGLLRDTNIRRLFDIVLSR